MHKVELLAPAGSYEAGVAAIQNGCDALYVGGSNFSARAFAHNLDHAKMQALCTYAHRYGVKVYVAINTLIDQNQMDACLQYVKWLYKNDIDALIIQDIGLMMRIASEYPDFELHASTQMHIHNKAGIDFIKGFNVKRVVLPRETSFENLAKLCEEDIEIEVFVHGALCISYSGQCYISEKLSHLSANKGACAQYCRMRYKLLKSSNSQMQQIYTAGDYLLSTKDLCNIGQIPKLLQLPINSLKIEGRMKKSTYVAQVVSSYRKGIDAYYNHTYFDYKLEEEAMKRLFNRSFTAGKVFGMQNNDFMQITRPNHMGIEIGKVISANKDKASVKLMKPLHQGDGIRFIQEKGDTGFRLNWLYKNGLLVASAQSGDIIEIDNTMNAIIGSTLIKSTDSILENQLTKFFESEPLKIPIKLKCSMKIGQPLTLEASDNCNTISMSSSKLVQAAIKIPLTKQRLHEQLSKSGSTIFIIDEILVEQDINSTIPISEINELRRNCLEKLTLARETLNKNRTIQEVTYEKLALKKSSKIIVSINTHEQYTACLNYPNIVIMIRNYSLYKSIAAKDSNVLYHAPLIQYVANKESGMVSDLGGLSQNPNSVCDNSIHVCNSESAYVLFKNHASMLSLSKECSFEQIKQIISDYTNKFKSDYNFMACVYERSKLMSCEHCLINHNEKSTKPCRACMKDDKYYLQDEKGRNFPLIGDDQCHLQIYDYQISDNTKMIKKYQEIGVSNFLLNFTFENSEEVRIILSKINMSDF